MRHVPVLLKQSVDGLNIKSNGIYIDGTLGRAGHAYEIVKRLDKGQLVAIDRDEEALREAKHILSDFENKIIFIHGDFKDVATQLVNEGIQNVDGMIFDLGVSSPQLDDARRGFSYMQDANLDMRMDRSQSLTAFDIINNLQEEQLKKILFMYGEERYAKAITKAIVKRRNIEPVQTTFELNDIIISAIPAVARREAQHPSKRTFQALRIAVNDELASLESMLDKVPALLKPGGRICVISFHSLEDRIVKRTLKTYTQGCICPKDIPVCVCGVKPSMKLITRKPLVADDEQVRHNPRARSAKLRIAERLRDY